MSDTLAQALVAAQNEMPYLKADGRNPHFGNDFVTLDNLIQHVRPILNKHNLSVIQFPTIGPNGEHALTTTLMHGPSGEQMSSTMALELAKRDMQGLGGAITYARRYMLAAAVGIAEGDDDGNTASAPAAKPAPAPAAKPAAAPKPEPAAPSAATTAAQQAQTAQAQAAHRPGGDFMFPSGKHKGLTLAEVDSGYLHWYLENGPREDVKTAIRQYAGIVTTADEDIPF